MNKLTEDELKLLLALNGNNRLPHLEEEIFKRSKLIKCYLSALHNNSIFFNFDKGIAHSIYYYAKYIMKSRWLVAERYIKRKDATIWSYYVDSVIQNHEFNRK